MAMILNGTGDITGLASVNSSVTAAEIGYLDGVTSALQTQINTKPTGGTGVWTSFSPTITQNVSVTYTSNYCKYTKIGNTVFYSGSLNITSAGTSSSAVKISLPITPITNSVCSGQISISSSGTNVYTHGYPYLYLGELGQLTTSGNLYGLSPTTALANGNAIFFGIVYEAA